MPKVTNLSSFNVVNKGLVGQFPKSFSVLSKLEDLLVSSNNFIGTIMAEFGSMTGFLYLELDGNDYTGTIPTEFANLVNLARFESQFQYTLWATPHSNWSCNQS
jgi:hypothetical protein